jgi:hypothetical protein
MIERAWYNGYTPKERDKNFKELKRQIDDGELPAAIGPCALCGDTGGKIEGHTDSEVVFEYHNEDYSLPLKTSEPDLVALCSHCHRNKLHKRFSNPLSWHIFLAHVRRGGFARDLKNPSIVKELKAYRSAIERGEKLALGKLGSYTRTVGEEWFARLRMDVESLKDPAARPRP